MAKSVYEIFNLSGQSEIYEKFEDEHYVLEIHEYCCDNLEQKHNIDTMVERFINLNDLQNDNSDNSENEKSLIRNIAFYCDSHHPNNNTL